jgi:hypothetical protein
MLIKDTHRYESALPPGFRQAVTRQHSAEWALDLMPKPGYRPLGYYITCVPDELYPWPEHQVQIIRRTFDPGFLPIFRKMVYQTPAGGILTFRHHGIARFDPLAKPDPFVAHARVPFWWRWEHPNVVERWLEPKERVRGSIRALNNLPKAFVPWTDWVLAWARETYWEASAAEKQQYQEEHGEGSLLAKARKHEEAEAEYRQKSEASYQKRLYESLGPEDERYAKGVGLGLVKPEPKPFCDLGGGV